MMVCGQIVVISTQLYRDNTSNARMVWLYFSHACSHIHVYRVDKYGTKMITN